MNAVPSSRGRPSNAQRKGFSSPDRSQMLALALITLFALGVRLYRLGAQCFWFDEAQTLFVAQFPWGEILARAYRPPLYHFMLHLWDNLVPSSEFWLRLPSALFGAAVPPLIYLLAERLYDRRTGLIAAVLAIVSPTLVTYAQELRMYSLMALLFALLLLLLTNLLSQERPHCWPFWAGLWLVTVIALYTHYFVLPFLLCLNLVALAVLGQGRRWRTMLRWLETQAAAGLAFVPWLMIIRGGRGGTEDYVSAEIIPLLPEIPGVRAFLMQTWLFYSTGPVTSDLALVRLLALAALVALAVALLLLLVRLGTKLRALVKRRRLGALEREHGADLLLLDLTIGPLAIAALMYRLRPGTVHPRHLMMIAVPFLILIARVARPALSWPWRRRPGHRSGLGSALIGACILALFGALFLVSLGLSYTDPALQRADVRDLAHQVASRTAAGDVVLLPYQDYAFDHYFTGPAQSYYIETRVGDADLAAWLLPRMQGAQRAVLVRWVHTFNDPRDFSAWLLQRNGRLIERFWVAERWVSVYDLTAPLAEPEFEPLEMRVDPLRITGIALPDDSPADQALPVALSWELLSETDVDYKASVRLVDGAGRVVSSEDRVIFAERAPVGTSRWRPGHTARNYYLLTVPVGTAPVDYGIEVSVYHEDRALAFLNDAGAALGPVQRVATANLAPPRTFPPRFPDTIPMTRIESEVAPGLLLEGVAMEGETIRAGDGLDITLYWRALEGTLPAYAPELSLHTLEKEMLGQQQGQPIEGRYPTDRWQAGALVADRRVVRAIPEAESGTAEVVLSVEDISLPLGTVTVEQTGRAFTWPEIQYPLDVSLGGIARLAGFAVEHEQVSQEQPLTLTLYWEALDDAPAETSYAVFAHLMSPDGQIMAQHDGPPAGGEWPTTSWVSGQAIVDQRELTFHDDMYHGQTLIAVGMYDPSTFQRLMTPQGDDRIILPISITVE